jgi:hypothetical protein
MCQRKPTRYVIRGPKYFGNPCLWQSIFHEGIRKLDIGSK